MGTLSASLSRRNLGNARIIFLSLLPIQQARISAHIRNSYLSLATSFLETGIFQFSTIISFSNWSGKQLRKRLMADQKFVTSPYLMTSRAA